MKKFRYNINIELNENSKEFLDKLEVTLNSILKVYPGKFEFDLDETYCDIYTYDFETLLTFKQFFENIKSGKLKL